MRALRWLRRNLGPLAGVLALLLAVSLLPPDTSLSEVRRTGTLRACVPSAYPPLVTGDPERPGIDVEILRAVADEIGVSLSLNEISAIGRDFNPRNWRLTRASCQVIAGGVVDAPTTRSFLETGPAYAATGWAAIAPGPVPDLSGRRVGVLTPVSGLDRIALGSYLRQVDAAPRIYQDRDALETALAAGEVDAGVTEALLALQIASPHGWQVDMMPPPLPRHSLVFGLWKGDLTLKRAIESAFAELEAAGTIPAILERYLGSSQGR